MPTALVVVSCIPTADCQPLHAAGTAVLALSLAALIAARPYHTVSASVVAGLMTVLELAAMILTLAGSSGAADGFLLGAAFMGFLGTLRTVAGMCQRVRECCGGGGAAAAAHAMEGPLLPIGGETEMTAVPPSVVPAKAAPVPKKATPKAATVVHDFEL